MKRTKVVLVALAGFNLLFFSAIAQNSRQISWKGVQSFKLSEETENRFLYFEGAAYGTNKEFVPYKYERFKLSGNPQSVNATINKAVYAPLTAEELAALGKQEIAESIEISAGVEYDRKEAFAGVSIIPFRKNPGTGQIEKLVSYEIEVLPSNEKQQSFFRTYNANSVLASGKWYKIGITQNGVYKIDDNLLRALGMDVNSIDPRELKVFGNGGAMLPMANNVDRHDDLAQNAVVSVGETDGSFDAADYLLFYGQGPTSWVYSTTSQRFTQQLHTYSDTAYYFITADVIPGQSPKRVQRQTSSSAAGTHAVTTFNDYAFHELEAYNPIKSGRLWLGENFKNQLTYAFPFSFPNIDETAPAKVFVQSAHRSSVSSTMEVKANNQSILTLTGGSVSFQYYNDYVKYAGSTGTLNNPSSNINISLTYNQPNSNSEAWLDYITVNARRKLIMSGSQMAFRDVNSVGAGNVAAYTLLGAPSGLTIWDVTDNTNPLEQEFATSGTTVSFKAEADVLKQYIAFTSYLTPRAFGAVTNQNLHALGISKRVDMVIVAHPNFMAQAKRLADYHKDEDGMEVLLVTPRQVYNEFSSGQQDATAIRELMKMLYDRAATPDMLPRYLLLFGDGSYDNKNRVANNTNFIPTFQSRNSHTPTVSYTSDDYFGLLDDNEGLWDDNSNTGAIDIGVGRLPVKSVAEATDAVNKIIQYADPSSFGDWRNVVAFIADDEDGNTHIGQADQLADIFEDDHQNYNVDKIYLDAYQQSTASGGERYPAVKAAITKRVNEGAFMMNYTGHGGEVGLAHERVVEIPDILSWDNLERMPVFLTATCEFSRFDDPERTSAGELLFLSDKGAGVALFTTVRLVYASPNFELNTHFYERLFTKIDGEWPRMGDVYRLTKVASGSEVNHRNFTLLGDPALKLAFPRYNVVTTHVNGQAVDAVADTLKALSKVTIRGYVANASNVKLNNFNGVLYPTVYDKPTTETTLANDAGSGKMAFSLQKSLLYKGKASVTNGEFEYTFIVPKDIAYRNGFGKISYYGEDGKDDAAGNYQKIFVGGTDANAQNDTKGPEVEVYLNDENFVSGGLSNEDPILYLKLVDSTGINTVGNGIGHDMVAVLDNDERNPIILNASYEAELNSYQRGVVKHQLNDIAPGTHTLKVKVWDVYNNSSESQIDFVVAEEAELALEHVLNYPNPFTTNTDFYFEHNHPGRSLDVMVQVYTVSGKLIKTLEAVEQSEGFRSQPINWDGLDDYGNKIGKGVYVYRVKVRSDDGSVAEEMEKLVILN